MRIQEATQFAVGPGRPKLPLAGDTLRITDEMRFIPIVGDPSLLVGATFKLRPLPTTRAAELQVLTETQAPQEGVQPVPAKAAPPPPTPLAGSDENATKPTSILGGSLGISGSMYILHLSGSTQANIANDLMTYGVPSGSADQWANTFLGVSQNHGVHSILVGAVAGSAVIAGIDNIDKLPQSIKTRLPLRVRQGLVKYRYTIGGVVALLVALLVFQAPRRDPLIGKWTLNSIESRYVSGDPPRGETLTVSSDRTGLSVMDDVILASGKADHVKYHLDMDGKEHAADIEPSVILGNIDTIRTTGDTTAFLKNGQVVRSDKRLVSPDQRQLTITSTVRTPNGDVKDTRSYERK